MTLDTFFEKFDLFADAPNAVAKMRELVISLAISGRLVPNNIDEKPVALKLTGSSEGESSLPANWQAGLLGDVFNFEYGDNLPAPKRSQSGEYPVYGSNGIVGTHDTFLTKEPCVIVGRKGSAGALNIATGPSWTTDVAYFVQPPSDVDLQFTYYLFSTLRLDVLGKGIKPGLSRKEAYALPLSLPPLAEQKRIVAKVDELMALCDRLEAQQLQREAQASALARASLARFAEVPTPANLNLLFHQSYSITPAELRKAILTLAVQGKLVPQDIKDANARDIIDRAMAKRQHTIKSKNLRRKELDETADLFRHEDLPTSWCVERFANLVDPENTISYGVLVPGNDVPDGIPFVRAQDLCLADHPARPNKTIAPDIEKSYARTRLTGGEILLCVVGSIGKLGTVPDTWAGANIARAVARIKPIAELLPSFLLLVLQENTVQTYFTSTTRTLAQPTLNVGMIELTPIPIPPIAEQRRIVAKVDQLMALVDQLETQLAASRATAKNLLEALVAELTGK